jgi:hypothetical protein
VTLSADTYRDTLELSATGTAGSVYSHGHHQRQETGPRRLSAVTYLLRTQNWGVGLHALRTRYVYPPHASLTIIYRVTAGRPPPEKKG